jgi:NTP pyrophosphatase (non-canonical NTP hydrolase)
MNDPLPAEPFTVAYLIAESWATAEAHGWHAEPRTFGDIIALMHSELSEALEEHRAGRLPHEVYHEVDSKPAGIPVELADLCIRIFDACGTFNIDLESALREKLAFNRGRPFRHGGKAL